MTESRWSKIFSILTVGGLIILALLPIFNVIFILAKNGVNSIHSDNYFVLPIIDRVFNGTYQWKNYFHDTFIAGHSTALAVLIQILVAYFFHWNDYVLLYLGVAFAIARIILIFRAFTYFEESRVKWVLLVILSALIFSTSQISTFEWDWVTIMQGLTQLGFALGVWGLVRFSRRWKGICLMVLGGLVASWSSGAGVIVWPVFLVGLWMLQFRRWKYYVVWLGAAILASIPYIFYMVVKPVHGHYYTPIPKINLFNFAVILQSVGYPFAQNFSLSTAFWKGIFGALLGLSGVAILTWNNLKIKKVTGFAAVVMYIFYGFLNIWQISIFRGELWHWYASQYMIFWVGLTGLAYSIYANWKIVSAEGPPQKVYSIGPLWSGAVFIVLVCFYLTSNLTFADKSIFLKNRSPASSSCLRNYRTAPTYCLPSVFCFDLDHFEEFPQMVAALQDHDLSVFSPHQQWFLQGDFILDNVQIHEVPGVPEIFWSADRTDQAATIFNSGTFRFDYRHLNLFLHSPNSVDWTFTLPKNLTNAVFHSAVAISQSAPSYHDSDGVTFEVDAKVGDLPQGPLFTQYVDADQREWIPFSVPLTKFAGQTVTLHLTSQPGGNRVGDWAMYRFPYLDIVIDPAKADVKKTELEIRPSNTDLSPSMPKLKEDDFQFDVKDPELWITRGMEAVKGEDDSGDTWKVGDDPQLEYKQPLNICLADYTHFYVRMSATENIPRQILQIFYRIKGQASFDEPHSVRVLLLGDGGMHAYTFDLKLLANDRSKIITAIRFDPVTKGPEEGEGRIKISDFRLIHGAEKGVCF